MRVTSSIPDSAAPTIAISINTAWNIYHFRRALIEDLRGAGYRVVALAPPDEFSERLRSIVDDYIPLPMDNAGTSIWRDAGLTWRYFKHLRALKPQALLTYTIKPNIFGGIAAAALGIPVIANVSGLGHAFARGGWLVRVAMLLYRVGLARAAWVFFQNESDRALFLERRLVRRERTQCIPGSGINLQYFQPRLDASDSDNHSPRFLLVARLLWEKGIGEYVAAIRELRATTHPHVQCALVGPLNVANPTAISAETVAQWQREGLLDYLGEREDIREVMAAHDVLVLPSYREGLSRVLLEGAAMGMPMIASDVPGCREVVAHGVNGLLVPPRDAHALAEAMRRMITVPPEERQRMGLASRAKAEAQFDEAQVLAAYRAAINAVCARGGGAASAPLHRSYD
jgi:glycosyltransferase involved in cell wall biosynthesis